VLRGNARDALGLGMLNEKLQRFKARDRSLSFDPTLYQRFRVSFCCLSPHQTMKLQRFKARDRSLSFDPTLYQRFRVSFCFL